MQDYRRLRAWRNAHALVLDVRRAVQQFPRSGYASLRTQMVRSSESTAFNIVEGCGSATSREFARFLEISIKSTTELEYQLRLARDYGIMSSDAWRRLADADIDVRRMLCGLRRKVLQEDPSLRSVSD